MFLHVAKKVEVCSMLAVRPSYSVYIYLNLFALPEHLHMLLTSIIVTNA